MKWYFLTNNSLTLLICTYDRYGADKTLITFTVECVQTQGGCKVSLYFYKLISPKI